MTLRVVSTCGAGWLSRWQIVLHLLEEMSAAQLQADAAGWGRVVRASGFSTRKETAETLCAILG